MSGSLGSTIHFKFRSVRAFSSVSFQGASLELKELKKLIVAHMKLDKEQDFDFKITDAKNNTGSLPSHDNPRPPPRLTSRLLWQSTRVTSPL